MTSDSTLQKNVIDELACDPMLEDVEMPILPLHAHTGAPLARAAANALEWNTLIPASVQLEVQDGWITLTGSVEDSNTMGL